jgi:hypothetical protein
MEARIHQMEAQKFSYDCVLLSMDMVILAWNHT